MGRPTPVQADPAALARAAELIARAERPVIVTEFTGRHPDAFTELVGFAEDIASAVVDMHGRVNFPTPPPLTVSFGAEDPLREADLVISLDVGDLHRALNELDRDSRERAKRSRLAPGTPIIDIGLSELRLSKWAEDLGDVQPVALSIVADTRLALPELRRLVRERARGRDTSARRREIAARHDAMVDAWERDAKADWGDAPMTAPRLASEIWSVVKK